MPRKTTKSIEQRRRERNIRNRNNYLKNIEERRAAGAARNRLLRENQEYRERERKRNAERRKKARKAEAARKPRFAFVPVSALMDPLYWEVKQECCDDNLQQFESTTYMTTPAVMPDPNIITGDPPTVEIYEGNIKQEPERDSSSPPTLNEQASLPTPQPGHEFVTYGAYIGNEMRRITNGPILVQLIQKINLALYEANLAMNALQDEDPKL